MWLLHQQGFTVRFVFHYVLLDGGNFQQERALFLLSNLLCSFKGRTLFEWSRAGACWTAGEQRGGAGAGQWSGSLDQEHRLVVFSSYKFLFQVVLQPRGMLQHPGYEKCQGRRCLWSILHFIYLLLLHKKKGV